MNESYRKRGAKLKTFLVFVFLLGSTIFLDRLTFGYFFFLFPNETEWDSSPWYNFLYQTKFLQKNQSKNRTIVTGSSVALYSVLPNSINQQLDSNSDVQFFSHVAMAPTDLYFYKEEILKTNPSLVVYVLNFADLQWEYFEPQENTFKFKQKVWLEEFATRYPAKTIYPFEYLKENLPHLPKKIISNLLVKSMFLVSRYRVFFWDPIEVYLDNHFRSGRKYHIYQGQIPEESIWSKGWTKQTATIQCKTIRKNESIFIQKKNTQVRFIFSGQTKDGTPFSLTKEILFDSNGWNSIDMNSLSENKPFSTLKIFIPSIESLSTAKEVNLIRFGKDEPVGIRLSHYFCKEKPNLNVSYLRQSFWDDTRISKYSIKEYEEDYFERMLRDADSRTELHRLHNVRKAKLAVNNRKFEISKELLRIQNISKFFYKNKIPFAIVLSPENPLEFDLYKNSQWRKEWILYLRNLLDENDQKLIDHTESIEDVRFFFDPHHLTYEGAQKYQSIFIKVLSK